MLTTFPLIGVVVPLPCTSWMGVAGAPHTSDVTVKLKTAPPAMLSGGSSVSWSATWGAKTVTVQVSPAPKSAVGSSENVVGPPETAAPCAPVVAHEMENQGSVRLTGSLNVIEMFAASATSVAPACGLVAVTAGGASWKLGVRLNSSTPSSSSANDALKSAQRIQNEAPSGIARFWIVDDTAPRFPAALPSSWPTVPTVTGPEKSSVSASFHAPVVRFVASRLYWKSSRSGPRPDVPNRHCSPTYAMASVVMVEPVLLVNDAPIVGVSVPESSVP